MKTNRLMMLAVLTSTSLFAGCYSKHLIFQAEAVSMTQNNAGSVKALKVGKEIDEKWCTGDDLAQKQRDDDKVVGLADQVIYKAQNGGKDADFILEARVFTDTDGCALLTGKQAKM